MLSHRLPVALAALLISAVPTIGSAEPASVSVFEAIARTTPSRSGAIVHVFPEGTRVSVSEETQDGWKRIRLPDGSVGWVEVSALRLGANSDRSDGAASGAPSDPLAAMPNPTVGSSPIAVPESPRDAPVVPAGYQAARIRVATELRSGPDKGAPVLAVLPSSVGVWASVRASLGYRRVRTEAGAAGFAPDRDVEILTSRTVPASAATPETRDPGASTVSAPRSGGAAPASVRPMVEQPTGTLPPVGATEPVASPAPQGYTVVRIGGVVPKHEDMNGFDTGLGLEVGFGLAASPNVALEAAIGRYTLSGSASGYASGSYVTAKENVTAIPVTTTVKAILGDQQFNIYALAGAGLYFISTSAEASSGYASASASETATAFGFHFGAGTAVHIDDHLMIGAELKYIIASAQLYDVTTGLDSLLVTGMVGVTF
jgi:opacity protein-like surface antigen